MTATLLALGCRLHGIEEHPPTEDPTTVQAGSVPWDGLPNHLDGDVYYGPTASTPAPPHHHGHSDEDAQPGHGTAPTEPGHHHSGPKNPPQDREQPASGGAETPPTPHSQHHPEGHDRP